MANKKEELEELRAKSTKDLWCADLDAFLETWNAAIDEDHEIKRKVRGLGRRASKKIGAGRNKAQSRLKKEEEDYQPKAANPAKGVVKVEPPKTNAFAKMFEPKPKKKSFGSDGIDEGSDLSDDDFAAIAPAKAAVTTDHANGRNKRAAAAKPKNWVVEDDESESDEDKLLGDVGAMVKGIGAESSNPTTGRVSLFAMSRPGSSSGKTSANALSKTKPKSKVIDLSDDDDQTNYEMLASPQKKAAPAEKDVLDSFLSDDDDFPIVPKKISALKAKPAPKPKPAAKPKPAPLPKKAATSKPTTLSPAAKAYATKHAKQVRSKALDSEDEDGDSLNDVEPEEEDEDESPVMPKRGRPARAAAVTAKAKVKAKPIYIDSEDDEEMDNSGAVASEQDSLDFDESD
jgi:DNA topoisomerase-2